MLPNHQARSPFVLKHTTSYLLASERSERDTYRGKNEKIGDVCLYICLDVRMSFCTLTLAFLC